MKLLNIAFDLDSTLADIMPVYEEILFEQCGEKLCDIRKFQIKTENDLPWSELEKCFKLTYQCWDRIEFYPGTKEFLRELYRAADSDPIRIITARPSYICANDTYKLCSRLDIPYELIITGTPTTNLPGQPEVNKFNYLNRYNFFVDDRRKTAIDLSSRGKYVFMPTMNYNILDNEYPNLEVINTVVDLTSRIKDFIVEV